ncbi:MAG TPA: 50S ribosomal protein L21 [Caldithrix abyssi]|uniref:Large ribosomal subunit protein bL21 n=1 Tax=Caldithrix abyssi TaxID=187145 RepID=A0A7V4U1D9_CALAY|nr:50S ribosomal protein L21 [Caldithrix abyssi]
MYAIVEIAGKQFRVEKDQKIKVPLLSVESGKKVSFDRVLFYADDAGKTQIGSPVVSGLKVEATVLEHGKDKKIIVFKKKRRKGYQKKNGHRQPFSLIQIEGIAQAKAKPAKKETAAKAAKAEEKPKAAPKSAKAKTEEAPKAAKKTAAAKTKAADKTKKDAKPKAAKPAAKAKTAAKPKAEKKDSAEEKEA